MRVCVGMRWIEFTRKGINKCKQDYTNKYKLPIDYVTNIFVCIVVGLVTMDANVEALGSPAELRGRELSGVAMYQ